MHTYKFFYIKTFKIAPTCLDPKIIFRELRCSLLKLHFYNTLTGWISYINLVLWQHVILCKSYAIESAPSQAHSQCCRARHGNIRTAHATYAAALKTTTHSKTRCREPYAATHHPLLLMMGVCTRNIYKITFFRQVGISSYFMRKMHSQTTLRSLSFYACKYWNVCNNGSCRSYGMTPNFSLLICQNFID